VADCLVVTLEDGASRAVRHIWHDLGRRFGVSRAHAEAEPHLTLAVITGRPDRAVLEDRIRQLVATVPVFPVTSAGFGVFLGSDRVPVVHLAVTRTPRLDALHAGVLQAVGASGAGTDGESAPEFWRPHVNLADQNLDAETVGRVMACLVTSGPRHWTAEITNVTLLTAAGPGGFTVALEGTG